MSHRSTAGGYQRNGVILAGLGRDGVDRDRETLAALELCEVGRLGGKSVAKAMIQLASEANLINQKHTLNRCHRIRLQLPPISRCPLRAKSGEAAIPSLLIFAVYLLSPTATSYTSSRQSRHLSRSRTYKLATATYRPLRLQCTQRLSTATIETSTLELVCA